MAASCPSLRLLKPARLCLLSLALLAALAASNPGWSRARPSVQALPQRYNVAIVAPSAEFRGFVLNDAGQVAGVGFGPNAADGLTRYDPETGPRVFGLPFGQGVNDIKDMNELGEIIGFAETRAFFLRSDGTFPELLSPEGFPLKEIYALNDAGQIVLSRDFNPGGRCAIWQNGVLSPLGGFPSDNGQGTAFGRGINEQGTVCGGIAVLRQQAPFIHAVNWTSPNSPADISPDAPGENTQMADRINASGQVLGWRYRQVEGQTRFEAWLRQPNGVKTLIGIAHITGATGSAQVTTGWRLTDDGQVLLPIDDDATNRHGVHIWQNGQAAKFDTLIPASSGLTVAAPIDMNNHGQLLTQVSGLFGNFWVILTPTTPETVKPVIANVVPAEGAVVSSPAQVSADLTDASSVGWVALIDKDQFSGIDVRGISKGPGAIQFERAMTGGAHTLDIEARDSSGNISTITRHFTVDLHAALKSFSFEPSTAKGGTTVTGKIELTAPAPKGGLTVTFKSSKKKALKPPKTFVIPAGAITPSFQYKTKKVPRDSTFTITAKLGDVTKTAQLNLTRR